MQSVSSWLKTLSLEQYSQVFVDNDVDLDVLRILCEKDLQDLGVSFGHRKKLLKAIAELNGAEAAQPAPGPAATPVAGGERRQLTVLFCDMVGFTELASRVDPEVLQRIIRSYEDACAVCVTRYEGYVFQRLGDGIVAFFGYPLAHEGEGERAIRAGLARRRTWVGSPATLFRLRSSRSRTCSSRRAWSMQSASSRLPT